MYASETNKSHKNYAVAFFLFFFVLLLFNVSSTAHRNNVLVPHVELNIFSVIFSIYVVFGIVALLHRPFIDNVVLGLFLGALLGLVPSLYTNTDNYWGNYATTLVSIASYFICMNSKGDFKDKIFEIFCLSNLVIAFQLIITEYHLFSGLSLSNLSTVSVKALISIPIGNSNFVAAFLLPTAVFIYSFKKNIWVNPILILSLYAIILCRSKTAISLALLISCFFMFKHMYYSLPKNKSLHHSLIPLGLIFIVLFLSVFHLIGIVISELQFAYTSTYENSFLRYLDGITSGRVRIIQSEFKRFLAHPLLGNGFGYSFGQPRSHNWVLELLTQRGLLGFVVYVGCVISLIRPGIRFYNSDKFVQSSINMLTIIFLQGLFEVTVFTLEFDFLIWSLLGFLRSRTRYLMSLEI